VDWLKDNVRALLGLTVEADNLEAIKKLPVGQKVAFATLFAIERAENYGLFDVAEDVTAVERAMVQAAVRAAVSAAIDDCEGEPGDQVYLNPMVSADVRVGYADGDPVFSGDVVARGWRIHFERMGVGDVGRLLRKRSDAEPSVGCSHCFSIEPVQNSGSIFVPDRVQVMHGGPNRLIS
jgi:hypothetical protein